MTSTPATIATTSAPAAVQTAQPRQCSCTPNRPTVAATTNDPSVHTPNPAVRKPGTQLLRHSRSNAAITTPAATLSRNAGPTTGWPRNTSTQRYRCTKADTSTATAPTTRIHMTLSVRRSGHPGPPPGASLREDEREPRPVHGAGTSVPRWLLGTMTGQTPETEEIPPWQRPP